MSDVKTDQADDTIEKDVQQKSADDKNTLFSVGDMVELGILAAEIVTDVAKSSADVAADLCSQIADGA